MEIIEVDEKGVRGLTATQVHEAMAGARGSVLSLTVRRHPEVPNRQSLEPKPRSLNPKPQSLRHVP